MDMNDDMETLLDGNAAGGDLREIFVIDVTAAMGQCNTCGQSARLGQAKAYMQSPGLVVRCRNCDAVLMRMVSASKRSWLDARGLSFLMWEMPAST